MQGAIDRNVGSISYVTQAPSAHLGAPGSHKWETAVMGTKRRPQLCGNVNHDRGDAWAQEGEGMRCRPTNWGSKFLHCVLGSG